MEGSGIVPAGNFRIEHPVIEGCLVPGSRLAFADKPAGVFQMLHLRLVHSLHERAASGGNELQEFVRVFAEEILYVSIQFFVIFRLRR